MQLRVLQCLLETLVGELVCQLRRTMLRPEELLNANLLLCLIYLLSFLEDGLGHGVLVWVLGRFVLDSRRVQRLAIQVLLLHLDLGQGIAVDILHCVTRLD